jgi:hypothetical protein
MINVPVYSDENGTPHIAIYVEDEDGTFRRTQNEPLRLLRDDIQGISISQGDMVSGHYDRHDRDWQTPTVTFHYGRPQSFYQFLRDKVAHNRFFVFAKPQYAGHIIKFTLHELKLKNSTSQRKVAILKEKYVEALRLWAEEELQALNNDANHVNTENNAHTANKNAVRYSGNHSKPVKSATNDPPSPPQPTARTQRNTKNHIKLVAGHKKNLAKSDIPATSRSTGQSAKSDAKQRKSLIEDFSLSKTRERVANSQKEHNKHFYDRFIFTID